MRGSLGVNGRLYVSPPGFAIRLCAGLSIFCEESIGLDSSFFAVSRNSGRMRRFLDAHANNHTGFSSHVGNRG